MKTTRCHLLRAAGLHRQCARGAPSRWSSKRSAEWQPLTPQLVVEVKCDQVTGNRFRHGTRLLRWRPDKKPAQCTFDQLQREAAPAKLVTEVMGRLGAQQPSCTARLGDVGRREGFAEACGAGLSAVGRR